MWINYRTVSYESFSNYIKCLVTSSLGFVYTWTWDISGSRCLIVKITLYGFRGLIDYGRVRCDLFLDVKNTYSSFSISDIVIRCCLGLYSFIINLIIMHCFNIKQGHIRIMMIVISMATSFFASVLNFQTKLGDTNLSLHLFQCLTL